MSNDSGPLPFKVGDILTDYGNIAVKVRKIASGGFGIVAIGIDQIDGQEAVLKTIRPEVLQRNSQVSKKFLGNIAKSCIL